MGTLDRLRSAFRKALGLADERAVDDLEYRAIEAWDSLAHMTLVATVEDEFGVMLDTDEVIDLSSFAKAVDILERHGVVLDG